MNPGRQICGLFQFLAPFQSSQWPFSLQYLLDVTSRSVMPAWSVKHPHRNSPGLFQRKLPSVPWRYIIILFPLCKWNLVPLQLIFHLLLWMSLVFFFFYLSYEGMRLKNRFSYWDFPMIDCSQAIGSCNYDSYCELIHLIWFSAWNAFNTHNPTVHLVS